MKKSHIAVALTLLFFLIVTMVAATAQAQEKKASFIPHWSPQAQFAGYYVAFEKGFYKKRGIDLTIMQGGHHKITTDMLEKEETDFATMWLSTAIQKRSQGLKLVNIGQIIQRSSLMLIAKKSRGITKPEDMNGKKVGLWGADLRIQPLAFIKKYSLNVKVIPQSYSINLFLRDGVDVVSAMWYNEYHTIINAGFNPDELTTFFFHEYGLNFPEDGIYILEKTYKDDPERAHNFVKASIEGWFYAFEHPDEAIDIVLKYMVAANVPANRVHQKWMFARMKDSIMPKEAGQGPIGTLNRNDYQRVCAELTNNGLLKEAPDFTSFFAGSTNSVQK
jgi:NitT/TauT family transport system substrate-binding protein